jgi:hypothetical protein
MRPRAPTASLLTLAGPASAASPALDGRGGSVDRQPYD